MTNEDKRIGISIIIPVHNSQKTLERCLQSLENQSFQALEVILVDNASVDDSAKIINAFCEKSKLRTRFIRSSSNEGPGGARNLGLKNAKGKYISFVDSDDWVDTDLYINVFSALERYNTEIAVFGVKNECGNTRSSDIRYIYPSPNIIDSLYALRLLCHSQSNNVFISPMVCQKVIKRSYIEEHNLTFIPNCYYEDDYFSLQCFLHKCQCLFVTDVFYHYYQNSESITHSFSLKHIDDLLDVFTRIYNDMVNCEQYGEHVHDFFSYFDKSISSMTNRLFAAENSTDIQRKYLNYLFKKLLDAFPIEYWIDYLDIQRIGRLIMG